MTREERQLRYQTREWAEKRMPVIERSGGRCERELEDFRCENPGDHVHHLTYIREDTRSELPEDLAHWCAGCHAFTHGKSHSDPIVEQQNAARIKADREARLAAIRAEAAAEEAAAKEEEEAKKSTRGKILCPHCQQVYGSFDASLNLLWLEEWGTKEKVVKAVLFTWGGPTIEAKTPIFCVSTDDDEIDNAIDALLPK